MRNPFLYLILLIAWIFAGAWFWNNASCCNISNPLSAKDGATVVASNGNNLRFALTSATAIIPDDIKPDLEKITAYLKAEPGRTFSITGLYRKEEKNNTYYPTLGMGRAEAIKAFFVGQGIAGSRIFTGDKLVDNLVVDNAEVIGPLNYEFGSRGIAIQDGDKFSASDLDNFLFAKSSFVHDTPISNELNGVMTSTAEYLKSNPNRSLKITGFYHNKEENKSILPNIGMARANDIKQVLVGLGASAGQISLDSKMDNQLGFEADKLYGGLSYDFSGASVADNSKDLDAIRKRLQANPIILYFATGDATLQLTAQQRKDFSDIIYYLDRSADGQLVSSGHTDDRGEYKNNQRLSRKRAEFVRDYLAKNGISAAKITATGFASDKPIGDNETAEGRQKNRRVEITIK